MHRIRGARSRFSLFALAFVCAVTGAASRADAAGENEAGEKPALVAVGEVSTQVLRSDVDLAGVMRAALAEELPALDLSRARRRPVILSVSLVRMETQASASGASTTAVISATLRTKRGGSLFAILEGKAQAYDGSKERRTVEQTALRSAVHGAINRIPEALAK
jgi:hypothetical protein